MISTATPVENASSVDEPNSSHAIVVTTDNATITGTNTADTRSAIR